MSSQLMAAMAVFTAPPHPTASMAGFCPGGGCGLKSIGEDPDARPVQVVERG
jgi:hypothetical protein